MTLHPPAHPWLSLQRICVLVPALICLTVTSAFSHTITFAMGLSKRIGIYAHKRHTPKVFKNNGGG